MGKIQKVLNKKKTLAGGIIHQLGTGTFYVFIARKCQQDNTGQDSF